MELRKFGEVFGPLFYSEIQATLAMDCDPTVPIQFNTISRRGALDLGGE